MTERGDFGAYRVSDMIYRLTKGESLIKACGCPKSRRKSGNTDRLSFGKADVFPAGLTSLSAQCGPIIREKKD